MAIDFWKQIIFEVDYETSSECDLSESGAWAYSLHPSTRILTMGVLYPDGKVFQWREGQAIPEEILFGKIRAHNWLFEYSIWNNVMTRYGFPRKPPEDFNCSMAQAYQATYPGKLEHLCEALGTKYRKDTANKSVMQRMAREPNRTFSAKDWERLLIYNVADLFAEREVSEILPPLQDCELPVFELDKIINLRGIPIDIELVDTAQKFIDRFEFELLEIFRGLTGLDSPRQVAELLKWANERGARLGSLNAAEVDASLSYLTGDLKRVLEIRRTLGLSSVSKLKSMKAAAAGGRVVGALQYHAASTGRWGGRLFQPQNLTKDLDGITEFALELLRIGNYDLFISHFPNIYQAIKAIMRAFIKAPEGRTFYGGDFNAIEARGVMWLAEDLTGINLFKGEGKIYEATAADVYGVPVSSVNKIQRQLGKQVVLGGGFGMGVGGEKFQMTCAKYGMDITLDFASNSIKAYRKKFSEVPKLWYGLQDAAIAAVRTGRTQQYKKIKYRCEGGFLKCKLPSGRLLYYPKPFLTDGDRGPVLNYYGVDSQTKKFVAQRSWGGVLTENCVQSVARDLMVNAMFNAEKFGYENILTVHDELVTEKNKGAGSPEELEKLMCQLPEWAVDFPVKAETWEGERFRK